MTTRLTPRINHLEQQFKEQQKAPDSPLNGLEQAVNAFSKLLNGLQQRENFLSEMDILLKKLEKFQADPLYREMEQMVEKVRSTTPEDLRPIRRIRETYGDLHERVDKLRELLNPSKFETLRKTATRLDREEEAIGLLEEWLDFSKTSDRFFQDPKLHQEQVEILENLYQKSEGKINKEILRSIREGIVHPAVMMAEEVRSGRVTGHLDAHIQEVKASLPSVRSKIESALNELERKHQQELEQIDQEIANDEAWLSPSPTR